jgi:Kef-type K+ transport system membrane component KefB
VVAVNILDLDLVIVFGSVVVTALIARWTQLPITALEILTGVLLVTFLGLTFPTGISTTDSLLLFGSLLIVFLAGLETNLGFLRANFQRAMVMGLGGFLVPFIGLFVALFFGIHAPLRISVVGATALADTSISIVYTTLQQYDLTNLPFGRLILAATLCVNLVEDFTITTSTLLTSPGFLFTLGILAALAVAALVLPSVSKVVAPRSSEGVFSNIGARTLFFSLAALALLSALVGVPGILFVFLLGLMFSQYATDTYATNIRNIAFAIFVPLYFVAVGLKVNVAFVVAHWELLVALIAVASVFKIAAIYVTSRRFLGKERAGPVAVLMNSRLTSATVILTLTLALGVITDQWYSLFITAVIILALGSVATLRLFPAFKNTANAKAFFRSDPGTRMDPIVISHPTLGASPPRGPLA